MFGVPVNAHAEEVQDLAAPGDDSTIKWFIGQDGIDRIAAGLVCGSCLEPFPAPPDIKNTKVWRDHAHHYAKLRTKDELLALVVKNKCPVCQSEVSTEMFAVTHKGADPFEPEKIEVPDE